MSKSASFIARWSRLKQEARAAAGVDSIALPPAPESMDGTVPGQTGTTDPASETALSTAGSFDLASLPPVESIVAGSDIRPFLQTGVPTELTRAALRSAWAADPAIRDFIGIAENQWDFNDPAGIPGFGPLGPTDLAQGFVGRALGGASVAAAAMVGMSALTAPPVAAIQDPRRDEHVDAVWLSASRSTDKRLAPDMINQIRGTGSTDAAVRHEAETEARRMRSGRRSHGGALPK